jgi:hypothetical protein
VPPFNEHIGGGDPEGVPEAQYGAVVSDGDDDLRGWGGETFGEVAYDLELVHRWRDRNQVRGSKIRG